MSEKAHHHLKDGRIITPTVDSMCGGLELKVGKLYLIAANNNRVGLCNYVKEYSKMTIVERRGFAGGYKKGCLCEVLKIVYIYVIIKKKLLSHPIQNWGPTSKCIKEYS